jgi:hypothetical protein
MSKDGILNLELEEMYQYALKLLADEQHEQVNEIFAYFFSNDIRLKEKLARAFMPREDDREMDPDKINKLIELQALHNSYHLNLFNAITDHLINSFQKALRIMEQNLEEGSKNSFEAQKLVRFYEVKLDKLMAPIETIQGSLYNDLKESYTTITNRRNEMITRITQKVISRETELMERINS